MPTDPHDEHPRLSDGREGLGDAFAQPVPPAQRELGEEFAHQTEYDGKTLGEQFAEPGYADRQSVASAFADPDSIDDRKLGKSFDEKTSSAKKHRKPLAETVAEPFKKPESRKIFYWVAAGVVCLMLLALLIGFLPRHAEARDSKKESARSEDEPEVEVMKVERDPGGSGLVVPGTTIPLTQSSVYARANGYLKARFVDIGDHVRKGQLLAIIDAPDLDQQVDQAREQVRQANAQLDQQKTQLALNKITNDRYQALVARGVFSRQDGDQQQANYQSQIANVGSAARNVDAFQANLRRVIALQGYERVTAPFDGIITQRNVDNGDLISTSGSAGGQAPNTMATQSTSSGTTQSGATNTSGSSGNASTLATPSTGGGGNGGPLFTIAQANRLRILVSVPEGYASLVKPGFHTQLSFQELPNQVFHGDVSRNAGSIDQNTRTLLTEIQIDNSAGKLMPGMYAVVTFDTPKGVGPLMVSGDAIAIRQDQPTVAVIKNGKVQLTPVTIGRDYGPEVEIVRGLEAGDLVATTFTDQIREGAKVTTKPDKQQAEKEDQQPSAAKPQPPGGSTQYGDPGIEDQDMQGQSAKPQQKGGGGAKKANPKGESKQ